MWNFRNKICINRYYTLFPIITLLTQDNGKLFQQLKSSFQWKINWKKYQSKVTLQEPNPNLDDLIVPSFQGVNTLFPLSFKNTTDRTVQTKYYLPTVEIKEYNVMINGENFFDKPEIMI